MLISLSKKLDNIQEKQKNIMEMIEQMQDKQDEIACICSSNAKLLKKGNRKTLDQYKVAKNAIVHKYILLYNIYHQRWK